MFIFNPKKIFFAKLSFFAQITKKSERLNWLSVLLIFFINNIISLVRDKYNKYNSEVTSQQTLTI